MNKYNVLTTDLYNCDIDFLNELFLNSKYPWEILPNIKTLIDELLKKGIKEYSLLKEGILVGSNVKIYDTAAIIPPAIIGSNTEIRPGAFLRGNVIIGNKCVIGNSTEIKNSILLNNVQVPHYNYVGDSILGNHSHLGAGAICSNLRLDNKNIIIHLDKDINTGLRKIGAFIGDNTQVGCGSILNPGTIIGKNSIVYPLLSIHGIHDNNSIIKK